VLASNSFAINNAGTLVLTGGNLSATDVDNAAAGLVFTISSITNGQFELVGAPGVPITSFTQAQIAAGQVQFVHDGSGNAPSFSIYVSDGVDGTGPTPGNIAFSGPGSGATSSNGGSAGGTITLSATLGGNPTSPFTLSVSPAVLPVVRLGLLDPVGQDFLRTFIDTPASTTQEAVRVSSEAPTRVVRAAMDAVASKVVTAAAGLPPVRAEAEALETRPVSAALQLEPVRAEMRAVPVRQDLLVGDEEGWRAGAVLNAIRIGGLVLSVGALVWAARAAGLLATVLASSPAWRHVDPLLALGRGKDEREDRNAKARRGRHGSGPRGRKRPR
jgi:hypothetical protein